jgi:hypothetical protein
MKIYRYRCRKIPISQPGKKAQDPHEDTGGGYQRPEGDGAENTKEWIGKIHEKTGEHQRSERKSDSVDCCPDSTEMVDLKNSQDEDTRHEGKEEETSDLSEEGDGESEDVEGYGAPEGKKERKDEEK